MRLPLRLLGATILAVIVAAVLPQTVASAAPRVLYVSLKGSDANPGTVDRPWRTIARSLPKLRAGETLYVRGGTYVERVGGKSTGFTKVSDGTPSSRIRVEAYPAERPVVQGLLWIDDPDYWTFNGLNVTWDSGSSPEEHMVRFRNGTGWQYTNSEIWGARSYANFNVLSTVSGEPANWAIAGNCIYDNVGDPAHGTAKDQLLYVNTGMSAGSGLIERNVIFGAPRGKGIKLAGPDPGTGSANVTVRYNTVFNTYKPAIVVGWATKNTNVYRNLVVKSQDASLIRGYELTGTGNVAANNAGFSAPSLVASDAGYQRIADGGGNAFRGDPLFNSTTTCSGFRPQNPDVQAFGRHAVAAS